MSDSPHSPEIDSEYFDRSLEQIRTKLLDKTRRNRLLNFKESGRDIAVIDEMPNQVHEHLVLEGASFYFLPLPDPDEGKHGAEARPSRELPSANHGLRVEARHRDPRLQTPFRQKELDRRLRRLFLEHRTIIEETGANNLYLAMGFLRWRDDQEATLTQRAPLMLVPVRCEREGRAGAARYCVAFDDEALDTNYSLFEKLKHSFDITLPLLRDEHIPEDYWQEVDEAIESKKKEGWQVVREVTIGLFRFQKQVMWRDLDPKRWPRHAPLVDKELVRRILVGPRSGESAPGILPETYHQDDPGQPLPSIRLIRDADSSQFAALVDALTREDGLVIEGPPGTGKSQTITNLIAAGLADGKTVLFVAEKMAALQVVYRRLEECRLGDFCLQIHGLKTGKKELLNSVETRMNRQARLSDNFGQTRLLLKKAHKDLVDTSRALAVPAGPEELPLHDIVWRVERLRQRLPNDFKPVEIPDPASLSSSAFWHARQRLEDLGREWAAIPANARQAWAGFRPLKVSDSDVGMLTDTIQEGVSAIAHFQEWLASFSLLRCLLTSLRDQQVRPSTQVRLIVVDNDAARSARSVVEEFRDRGLPIVYDCEPESNISLARNRALTHASGEWIASIDDDAIAAPDWLARLLETAEAYHADVVFGAVERSLPVDAPRYLCDSGVFQLPNPPTGTSENLPWCTTPLRAESLP